MPHVCSYPYPTDQQAVEGAKTLFAKLTGQDVEIGCLAHCAYTVAGYGLSLALPDDHSPHPHPHPVVYGATNLSTDLKAFIDAHDKKLMLAWNPAKWLAIAKMILALLEQWTNNP